MTNPATQADLFKGEQPPAAAQGTDPSSPSPDRPVAIRCRGVVKSFGSQTVLHNLDLDIYEGETMVIMGGSGSGKSTLLRTIIGSHRPDQGSIEMFSQKSLPLWSSGH